MSFYVILVDTAEVINAEPPHSEVERPADLPAAPAAPCERKCSLNLM